MQPRNSRPNYTQVIFIDREVSSLRSFKKLTYDGLSKDIPEDPTNMPKYFPQNKRNAPEPNKKDSQKLNFLDDAFAVNFRDQLCGKIFRTVPRAFCGGFFKYF